MSLSPLGCDFLTSLLVERNRSIQFQPRKLLLRSADLPGQKDDPTLLFLGI